MVNTPLWLDSPQWGLGLPTVEVSRSNTDTPHSVGLLRTSDRTVARDLYLTKHPALTRERYPCPQRSSNPQSQQARDRRLIRLRVHDGQDRQWHGLHLY